MSTAKMNAAIKARWVAALRSGEYKQGMGELRSANGCFCCIGVLCDIVEPDSWVPGDDDDMPWGFRRSSAFDLPPSQAVSDLGIDWRTTFVTIGEHYATLYDHNDFGCTFAEIADAIEEQL